MKGIKRLIGLRKMRYEIFLFLLILGAGCTQTINEECVTKLKEKTFLPEGPELIEQEGRMYYHIYDPAMHWFPGCHVYIDVETGLVDSGDCVVCDEWPSGNITLLCMNNEPYFSDGSSIQPVEKCQH